MINKSQLLRFVAVFNYYCHRFDRYIDTLCNVREFLIHTRYYLVLLKKNGMFSWILTISDVIINCKTLTTIYHILMVYWKDL